MGVEGRSRKSPFLYAPRARTAVGDLVIVHLKRDRLDPVILREDATDGYAEGAVENNRFGSFPHSTLIGVEWGSQVGASKVDTGKRGRRKQKKEALKSEIPPRVSGDTNEEGVAKKRKVEDDVSDEENTPSKKRKAEIENEAQEQIPLSFKQPIHSDSGFVHILPPTPETWTSSLPHRTQVVYTPDYSYILSRLKARPGSRLIEAGAGSGSFTHAAARAVFNQDSVSSRKDRGGRVFSYEFNETQRFIPLQKELRDHGLDDIVTLTHRDVCKDGFSILGDCSAQPSANAVFLDLPAPWLALPHLTRTPLEGSFSPLNPNLPVRLCTFSPCIEQVQATTVVLRRNGWVEINVEEIMHKRLDVRREQIGLKNEGLRGVNASAASVDEAIERLREVEGKFSDFHAGKTEVKTGDAIDVDGIATVNGTHGANGKILRRNMPSKAERLEKIKAEVANRKLYLEGRLVHRSEADVKTHTSYLVFATLPRAWSEEDEKACEQRWSVTEMMKTKKEGDVKAP